MGTGGRFTRYLKWNRWHRRTRSGPLSGVWPVIAIRTVSRAGPRCRREGVPGNYRGYNVLSDSSQRARYDQTVASNKPTQQRAKPREVAKAFLAKAVGLANAGQALEAREYFAQAVSHDPDSPRAHHLFGMFLARQAGGLEEALRHIDQAVKLEPNDVKI